jgi:hypothetical protein
LLVHILEYERRLALSLGFLDGCELPNQCSDALLVQFIFDLRFYDVNLRAQFSLLGDYFLLDVGPGTHVFVSVVVLNLACFAVLVPDGHLFLPLLTEHRFYKLSLIGALFAPLCIEFFLFRQLSLHFNDPGILQDQLIQQLALLLTSKLLDRRLERLRSLRHAFLVS